MNFKRLPKEKRNQLVLVLVVTAVCLVGWGLGLIRYQYSSLHQLSENKVATEKKLVQMRDAVKQSDRLAQDLSDAKKSLGEMESDIASGDLYSWIITTIRRFRAPYKVEIPSQSPIGPISDVTLLANFPYKQTSINVSGTAHYHDLGRFIADFENQFPHIRLMNLNLDLDGSAAEPETLSFRMEIVTLVKPNAS
jgi:Tfp pilus assembly protein PilO